MERGKRISIKPIDNAVTSEMRKKINKLVDKGLNRIQAGCYISNYYDDYICSTYNGGCKNFRECQQIDNELKSKIE